MKVRVRELGQSVARCVQCRTIATLTLRETRYARRWSALLDASFDPAPLRCASCSSCGQTYPVRSTDHVATFASARGSAATGEGGRWQYPAEQSCRPAATPS